MVGERGLKREVLAREFIGWDSWTQRVVIPYWDAHGVLVGFNARSPSPDHSRRYMVLGDDAVKEPRYGVGYGFDMMQVEQHLYGLNYALGALRKVPVGQRELVVVEGEINRLTIVDEVPGVVSCGNAWLSREQVDLLRRNASSSIFFFDSDDAGETALWGGYDVEKERSIDGVVQRLSPFQKVRVVDEHEGDANSMGAEAAVDLIAGAKFWMRAMIE